MITIEDLLEELYMISASPFKGGWQRRVSVNPISAPADRKFLQDLASRTRQGGQFSTKQAFIALKIIRKYAKLFGDDRPEQHFDPTITLTVEDVNAICNNPSYRTSPYQSTNIPREVRYIGNRKLAIKCKYAPQIITKVKALSDSTNPTSKGFPYFNKVHKVWVVDVTEKNLNNIMKLIKKFRFQFDDVTLQFLTDCSNANDHISSAVIDEEEDKICVVVQHNQLLSGWLDQIILPEVSLDV